MNIVHLYDGHEKVHNGRGSVPKVVWKTAKGTAALGHDVTVIERQWRGLDSTAIQKGVRFERLDLPTGAHDPWERVPYDLADSPLGMAKLVGDRTVFAVTALRRLRSMEVDVLHVHLPFAANVLLTVAPRLRRKTVFTAHLGELRMDALADEQRGGVAAESPDLETVADGGVGAVEAESDGGGVGAIEAESDEVESPRVLRFFSPDMLLARRAAHTTALNPNIASVFAERGIPAERVSVVPNGVDVDRFADVPGGRLDSVRGGYDLGGGPVLLFVGTVMPRKGVDDLVRTTGHLVHERGFDDLQVIVAGEDELDGKYTARVRDIARQEGVTDRLTFAGFVPEEDLPALYALADAFVLPSREEGFGMTVAEAMAAGTPVVATDVGGVPMLVDEGEQGFLARPNDPVAFAGQVERLLSRSGAERTSMSEQAHDRAKEYSWNGIARQFETVYENVRS